jgi:hypothetical protein
MTLPTEPKHLQTRYGARVTRMHEVTHTDDNWFVVCDVEWPDGQKKERRPYHPGEILYETDEHGFGHKEVCDMSAAVMEHLGAHGTWDEKGRWTAHGAKTPKRRGSPA